MRNPILLVVALLAFSVAQAENLAGRTFNRTLFYDFAFDPPYEDFAGITFNPLSQTLYMTDNKLDTIFEINGLGAPIRQINIAGLKAAGEAETDAEGITWMYGNTYALVLEGGEEMAVVTITSTTTAITRSQAQIFDLSGDPKGVTYKASEDALYWVSEVGPKRVIKARINPSTGNLDQLANINVESLPMLDLADIAYFPRLSPHMILVSQSSRTVVEVDLAGALPVVKSTFSLAGFAIPQAGGITFNHEGKMVIVGKHTSTAPEDDFNVFYPTAPIVNRRPTARITAFGAP